MPLYDTRVRLHCVLKKVVLPYLAEKFAPMQAGTHGELNRSPRCELALHLIKSEPVEKKRGTFNVLVHTGSKDL